MKQTTVLFRPVGEDELRLIAASGYQSFPPRLPGQPIFYPVLNEEYATQIARDWNTSKVAKGRHTLSATARDAAGRTVTVGRAVRVCK